MVNKEAIISIVSKIGSPCKKTLQKIVFLIEAKGVDLGCDYGIHFYGPYSADLDFTVYELSDEGKLNVEYTRMEHKISVTDGTVSSYDNETVNSVIDEFATETASELELIATALYVYVGSHNTSGILDGVKKIKGSKYSDERIIDAINKLEHFGYFAA